MYDLVNNNLPPYISEPFNRYRNPEPTRRLRHSNEFRFPHNMSQRLRKSTVPSSIRAWEPLPDDIKMSFTKYSFKYKVRLHLRGKRNPLVTTKMNLPRNSEITLNRTRVDLIFKCHLFNHNFDSVSDPSCRCGHRAQSTLHLLLQCPLFDIHRTIFLDDLGQLPSFNLNSFLTKNMKLKVSILLHGDDSLPLTTNVRIISLTSTFLGEIVNILNG